MGQAKGGNHCDFHIIWTPIHIVTTQNDHPIYVQHVLGNIYVFFTIFGSIRSQTPRVRSTRVDWSSQVETTVSNFDSSSAATRYFLMLNPNLSSKPWRPTARLSMCSTDYGFVNLCRKKRFNSTLELQKPYTFMS